MVGFCNFFVMFNAYCRYFFHQLQIYGFMANLKSMIDPDADLEGPLNYKKYEFTGLEDQLPG